jgi:NAD(P)-dependent dehydrogenase (short-subunit alcohol dehydrogenase family)
MAKGLAEHGAKVAIVGRNLETAEKVVKEIILLLEIGENRSKTFNKE